MFFKILDLGGSGGRGESVASCRCLAGTGMVWGGNGVEERGLWGMFGAVVRWVWAAFCCRMFVGCVMGVSGGVRVVCVCVSALGCYQYSSF